ncbi:hypothetical protein E2C01_075574 [Portunus trituberculatus]|uniref:Uncharacterized protein n=1 Tax=Portunus trituberculatus TaxID=210409 RepID=A0A5B7IKJ7_PORTR|nr:hypothetical protein [Portunus trituberculatus]
MHYYRTLISFSPPSPPPPPPPPPLRCHVSSS